MPIKTRPIPSPLLTQSIPILSNLSAEISCMGCMRIGRMQYAPTVLTETDVLYQIRFTEYPYNERVKYCYIAPSCLDQYT